MQSVRLRSLAFPSPPHSSTLPHAFHTSRHTCRYGTVQSVRLRSLALDRDAKGSRRVRAMLGKLDASNEVSNAYVVFDTEKGAEKAMSANMTLVGNWGGFGMLGRGRGQGQGEEVRLGR